MGPLAPALSSPTALASPSSRSTPLLSPPLLTMARGVLRPSLRPRLIPTFFMVDTTAMASAMDTDTDTDTPMATIYYGKRSAEAEPEAKADPYLLYGGYYGHGLGYGYGYGYPYAYGGYYYGK